MSQYTAAAMERFIVDRLQAAPGAKTAEIRMIRREFSRKIVDLESNMVLDLASRLLKHPPICYRFVAYELIHSHRGAFAALDAPLLQSLAGKLDSWGAVDLFACLLAGPAWRDSQIPDRLIRRWAESTDRWWRRAALVSTVALNRRTGAADARRTIRICKLLVDDRDDMVVKAMSWALRELSKRDPGSVRRFLAQHRIRLAARVLREVNNKLLTGVKNPG